MAEAGTPAEGATPPDAPRRRRLSPAALPSEVLLQVFKWLPAKDVVSVSLVCRKFYRCSVDPSVWFALCQGGTGREGVRVEQRRFAPHVDWRLEFRWRHGRWRVYDMNRESGSVGHKGIVWDVQYDEDTEKAFTASADGTIKIFSLHPVWHPYLEETQEFRCAQTIPAFHGLATRLDPTIFGASLAIRRLSSKALLSSWEGYLRVLDVEYGRFLATWLAHEKTVSSTWSVRQAGLPASAAPSLVATGSADRTIRLFDLRTPPTMSKPSPFASAGSAAPAKAVMEFRNLEGTVLCLAQQRGNDNMLVAGGRFKSISLFDLRQPTGSTAADVDPAPRALKHLFVGAYTYALLPDPLFPNCMYSGSGDRRGAILDRWRLDETTLASPSAHTGLISRLRGSQTPHRSFISAIAARDDLASSTVGGSIVTASWDGVLSLWDPATSCQLPHPEAGDNDPKVRRAIVQAGFDASSPHPRGPARALAPPHAAQSASFTGLALGRTRILASHFGGAACLDLSPRFFHRQGGDEYSFDGRDVWEDPEEDEFRVAGREWPAWMRPTWGMRGILGRMVNGQGGHPPAGHS
ncbi:WD40-repeat-containing domain protein [Hyaloraphidium curvatum]|nr:WD40-repeat-containing domain protein [Hyaloraphidium curvatum]